MKIKKLAPRSPWRTVLLVMAVVVADLMMSISSVGLGMDDGTVPNPETAGIEWARFGFAPFIALLGAVALIWRHRFPKSVAAATAVLGALSFSGVAFFVAFFLLAKRRLDWWVAAVIVLSLGAEALLGLEPLGWDLALIGVVILAAIAVWGAYRGQHARLLESRTLALKERAERVEAERAAEITNSKLAERHRIAREMHDTLAHRMSLVAVQAAALQVGAPDKETASAALLMRQTAHEALEELREVLGVLHDDVAHVPGPLMGNKTSPRQAAPGTTELAELVAQWQEAGIEVNCALRGDPEMSVPDAVSRAAYRVAQEGITNAVRHAPGGAITLNIQSDPSHIQVTVENTAGESAEPALGAGRGLVGLQERVEILDGTLSHSPIIHNGVPAGFRLLATIPLPISADDGGRS